MEEKTVCMNRWPDVTYLGQLGAHSVEDPGSMPEFFAECFREPSLHFADGQWGEDPARVLRALLL